MNVEKEIRITEMKIKVLQQRLKALNLLRSPTDYSARAKKSWKTRHENMKNKLSTPTEPPPWEPAKK